MEHLPELGNLAFGNSRGEYHVSRSHTDYFQEAILEALGFDGYGWPKGEKAPGGWREVAFNGLTNGVFTVRPYWWGDCTCGWDEDEGRYEHKPECALAQNNFECHPLGFTLQWYKYSLRDSYSNKPLTTKLLTQMGALAQAGSSPTPNTHNVDEPQSEVPKA